VVNAAQLGQLSKFMISRYTATRFFSLGNSVLPETSGSPAADLREKQCAQQQVGFCFIG
jgi:hypothetical protein